MKELKPKRRGQGIETKTFVGASGYTYIVYKTRRGAYHVFVEVEAKDAAIDVGSGLKRGVHTHDHWDDLWDE